LNALGSFIFEVCCRQTDKQTDRQTDGSEHSRLIDELSIAVNGTISAVETVRSDGTRSCERQQADISDAKSSTGEDHESELDRGPLENVELMNKEKRRSTAVKLASASCEIALALVYSDESTQLREIAKVDSVSLAVIILVIMNI